jgi:hypothetical protein
MAKGGRGAMVAAAVAAAVIAAMKRREGRMAKTSVGMVKRESAKIARPGAEEEAPTSDRRGSHQQ